MTRNTNDLTLAVARAERDLGCRYTLGFYERWPREDERHEVRIRVLRSGLRAVSANGYTFRSRSARRQSLIQSAFMVPGMFETGVVRAHVFPLQPLDSNRWRSLVAVEFPSPVFGKAQQAVPTEFGFTIRDKTRVLYRLGRTLTLQSRSLDDPNEKRVSFLADLDLKPGEYTVTAVMIDPVTQRPSTTDVKVRLPKIPRRGMFLVGPYLGIRADDDLVVHVTASPDRAKKGEVAASPDQVYGSSSSFEPLLVQRVEDRRNAAALTQACAASRKGLGGDRLSIRRSLLLRDGTVAGTVPDVPFELAPSERWQCQPLLDVLPLGSVQSGQYVFEASIGPGDGVDADRVRVEFTVAH